MPCPRHHHRREDEMGSRLEPLPSAFLDELISDPTDAIPRPVVTESRAGDGSQPDIGVARGIAVTTLEAEIDCAAVDQGHEIAVSGLCGCCEFGQDVERGERRRVAHYWQFHQFLDGPAAELR